MTTEQFLSQLNPDRVEQHRINYKGQVFARPYQTVFINGEEIPGLREMKQRFALFKSIFDENKVNYTSYLDVGCNLSYFPRQFSQFFGDVTGVEYDSYYINLVRQLYPQLNVIQNDLNQKRLSQLFNRKFECITALSMIEYIHDKHSFVKDLYDLSEKVVIVEGHSLDINNGNDNHYEAILRTQPWSVTRIPTLTDNGINAPPEAKGRPVWVCRHEQ